MCSVRVCLRRSHMNTAYCALLEGASATLPAADQAAVRQAEVALMLWPMHVHAYPTAPFALLPSWDVLVADMRLIPLSAAFSHSAYVTVMDHVSGRLPLHDWEPVTQVGAVSCCGSVYGWCALSPAGQVTACLSDVSCRTPAAINAHIKVERGGIQEYTERTDFLARHLLPCRCFSSSSFTPQTTAARGLTGSGPLQLLQISRSRQQHLHPAYPAAA